MPRTLFLIAGETSGDAYGAALARELHAREPDLRLTGLGGPKMADAGVALMQDLTHHAMMGLYGVFDNLAGLLRAYRTITHRLSTDRPDGIVLIDFPEFNLAVAKHAKRLGIPVIYYVSPQIWAWRTGRVHKIARRVTRMLVLFAFERDFYARYGVDVTHVGHPLLDTMADKLAITDRAAVRRALGLPEDGRLVGLLPGSRRKEVLGVFPLFLESAKLMLDAEPDLRFVVARAPALDPALFEQAGRRFDVPFTIIDGRAHDVMIASDMLLCCSGTATLEAGLLRTPMVSAYRTGLIAMLLFGPLIRPGALALANIVAEDWVIPECYGPNAKPEKIAKAGLDVLGRRDEIREKLAVIREKLGEPGATGRAADEVLDVLGPPPGLTP
jgi:lipid-A-disaccharide synthase